MNPLFETKIYLACTVISKEFVTELTDVKTFI